jgi:hypothetical protein
MKKLTNHQIFIIVLCVLCVVFGYILNNSDKNVIDDTNIQYRIDSLKKENEAYLNAIIVRNSQNFELSSKIDKLVQKNDSLEKAKKPIIYIIGKYENFKSPNYNASADTMRFIFTENNIK